MGTQRGADELEDSAAVPHKIKYTPSNPNPTYLPKRNENMSTHRTWIFRAIFRASIIHTSPKLDINQKSINRRTDNQIVIYRTYCIPLSNKKRKEMNGNTQQYG